MHRQVRQPIPSRTPLHEAPLACYVGKGGSPTLLHNHLNEQAPLLTFPTVFLSMHTIQGDFITLSFTLDDSSTPLCYPLFNFT